MNLKINYSFVIFVLFILSTVLFGQDISRDNYVNLIQINDPQERIDSLKKFRTEYPESRYFGHSLTQTFSAFVQLGNSDSAIVYAEKLLSKIPENARENYYNNFAYQLAEKKIGLDSAQSFINKAVASAKINRSKLLSSILDTQAFVLYNLGKADSALTIQKELMPGNEDDPSYITNLAIYQEASGDINSALISISKAILLGRSSNAVKKLNSWIENKYPNVSERKKAETDLATQTINEYLSNDNSSKKKSNAAAFLAVIKTDLKKAETLAQEAVSDIDDKTSVDDLILYRSNLAVVEKAKENYTGALNELMKVEGFAVPWDYDYWYLLGSVYEKLGQNEKALDAYLVGLIFPDANPIGDAAERLMKEGGIDINAVGQRIEKLKEEMKNFDLGKFQRKSKSKKVVVVELFTGAECPPCVAADKAFDKLSEYYPKDAVIILEYHVHIPGPDPMTNPSSFSKYTWYGGNFGTPTVFFDGVENIVGGGPDLVAKNRATVYKYSIDKYLNEQPDADINGKAELKNDKIFLNIDVGKIKDNSKNCSLQIALVEKSIDYTGANGIGKHLFVVRDLVNGTEGIKINQKNGKQNIKDTIDVAQVEQGIKSYLDDPTTHPSWRSNVRFTGWRARPDKIDRGNLAVVVYIQNADTKKILQAKYFDLSPKGENVGMINN